MTSSRSAKDYSVEEIPLAYAPVPAEMLLYRPKVTDAEMKVWCAFAMHRHLKNSTTFVGQQRVSEIIGVDRTTVGRAVTSLIKKGFLIDRGRQKDPDTGQWQSRVFQIAVGGKPVTLGLVHQRTPEENHDAPTHHGELSTNGSKNLSTNGSIHAAPVHHGGGENHDAPHDAVHDALHAAPVHPKEEKEIERRERDIRSARDAREGEPHDAPGEEEKTQEKVKPIPTGKYVTSQLMDKVTQAKNRGWRIKSPTDQEKRTVGSMAKTAIEADGYDIELCLHALDYMTMKAGGQIPEEPPAWCSFRTALDRVDEGWRSKPVRTEEMTEEDKSKKRRLAELTNRAMQGEDVPDEEWEALKSG